jgi:hypothetical protein
VIIYITFCNINGPIKVDTKSKVCTVFATSNTGIVGLNPTSGLHVCVCVVLCVRVLLCIETRNWKSSQSLTTSCRAIADDHNNHKGYVDVTKSSLFWRHSAVFLARWNSPNFHQFLSEQLPDNTFKCGTTASFQTEYQYNNINIISNSTGTTITTTIFNINSRGYWLESSTKLVPLFPLVVYFPEPKIRPNKSW